MKVKVTDKCIGCGMCVGLSPQFELSNSKAIANDEMVDDIDNINRVAELCPVDAIEVE